MSNSRAVPPLAPPAPDEPPAVARRSAADYRTPPAGGLRVTWLGHSMLLLETDARRVLLEPVWRERASPLSFVGPKKRFFAPSLAPTELPSVKALVARNVQRIVPLGVARTSRRGCAGGVDRGVGLVAGGAGRGTHDHRRVGPPRLGPPDSATPTARSRWGG